MLSSNCAIDEMMVHFTGWSMHTVKMPKKSIHQGYKIVAIYNWGYTLGFDFYSKVKGASGVSFVSL